MPAIWIHRDEHGIVDAASVAEYTEPKVLREWKSLGGTIEMIEAPSVTVGQRLPPEARIVR
jgi:hypothetical protein